MSKRQHFEPGTIHPATALDEKGRCCGVKPLIYKRPHYHTFCTRCDRSHGEDGDMLANWAWAVLAEGKARRRLPY